MFCSNFVTIFFSYLLWSIFSNSSPKLPRLLKIPTIKQSITTHVYFRSQNKMQFYVIYRRLILVSSILVDVVSIKVKYIFAFPGKNLFKSRHFWNTPAICVIEKLVRENGCNTLRENAFWYAPESSRCPSVNEIHASVSYGCVYTLICKRTRVTARVGVVIFYFVK